MESAADGFFVELHHRLAIGFLVGGVLECVEGERVIVGRGDFFFDEAAEDAGLDWREVEVHLNMIHDGLGDCVEAARWLLSGELLHELLHIEGRLVVLNAGLHRPHRKSAAISKTLSMFARLLQPGMTWFRIESIRVRAQTA